MATLWSKGYDEDKKGSNRTGVCLSKGIVSKATGYIEDCWGVSMAVLARDETKDGESVMFEVVMGSPFSLYM